MSSNRKWFETLLERGKAKSALLALSVGLALGFAGGHSLHSNAASTPKAAATDGQAVSVPVHSGKNSEETRDNRKSINNQFHRSITKHSLPSSMFEPWWRTMMHDPDADWILKNFDPLSEFDRAVIPAGMGSFMPRLDTMDLGNEIKVTAEVPGIDQANLDVTVADDTITIKGEKKDEVSDSSKSNGDLKAIERSYGSFQRTVSLPCKVLSDKAEAILKNGVLTVTVPKSTVAETPAKKLTIRTQ